MTINTMTPMNKCYIKHSTLSKGFYDWLEIKLTSDIAITSSTTSPLTEVGI